MASQAQINEQKWQAHCQNLAKAGLLPSEQERKGYQQQSPYWNTWDPDASNALKNVLDSTPSHREDR